MGNKLSCCITRTHTNGRGKSRGGSRQDNIIANDHAWHREDSSANVPHISEREPDDIAEDPSSHPTKGSLFMERSKSEAKIIPRDRRSFYADRRELTQKSSSCSTIFLDDSTITQPNLKNTIKCISLAVFYHIKNRRNRGHERLMEIFDEKLHPLTKDSVPSDYDRYEPEHRAIYRFIRTLFNAAQLTAECAIITLVYIERLLTYAEIDIGPSNWRRMVLGAILLASKVWDDQAVWNVDYCQILRDTTVEDMNELERQFLECLQFNINVPSSVYAKYYFDLRTLAGANDLQLPLQPLYTERAKKLEALSRLCEDKLADAQKRTKRRWKSLDRFVASPRNTVVLS